MLEIRHLVKSFGPLVAVDDVSFTVPQGEVLGFLRKETRAELAWVNHLSRLSGAAPTRNRNRRRESR